MLQALCTIYPHLSARLAHIDAKMRPLSPSRQTAFRVNRITWDKLCSEFLLGWVHRRGHAPNRPASLRPRTVGTPQGGEGGAYYL